MRQRAEDQAQQALARADGSCRRRARPRARRRPVTAHAYGSATQAERDGPDVVHLTWHRNWIVVKTRDCRGRGRLDVRDRLDSRELRLQQAQEALKQRRVLERFKDRARLACDTEAARREMQAIDELATTGRRVAQETASEHTGNRRDSAGGQAPRATTDHGPGDARPRPGRVPEAADDAAAEPGSDQAAGQRRVHRAAGDVQLAREAHRSTEAIDQTALSAGLHRQTAGPAAARRRPATSTASTGGADRHRSQRRQVTWQSDPFPPGCRA